LGVVSHQNDFGGRYGDLTNCLRLSKPKGYLSSHNVNYGFTRRDTGGAK
jgi:hypothetical protein